MPQPSQHKDLEQRLERKINGLFIIHEIGRALQRTTDPDELLYIVLVGVTAGEALKFNRVFLCLLNEEKPVWKVVWPSDRPVRKRQTGYGQHRPPST